MANSNNGKKQNGKPEPISVTPSLDKADKAIEDIDKTIYGKDVTDYRNNNTRVQMLVQATVNNLEKRLTASGIDNPITRSNDLLTAVRVSEDKVSKQSGSRKNTPKSNNPEDTRNSVTTTFSKLNKELNSITDLSSLMIGQESRIANYAVLRQITDFIVEIQEAGAAYVDNLIAPDNFNTSAIPITVVRSGVSSNDETTKNTQSRIKLLDEKYSLSEKIQEATYWSLLLGDYFIATIPAGRIIREALTESSDPTEEYIDNIFIPQITREEALASITSTKMLSDNFLAECMDENTNRVASDKIVEKVSHQLATDIGLTESEIAEMPNKDTLLNTLIDDFNESFTLCEDTQDIAKNSNKFIAQADVVEDKYKHRYGDNKRRILSAKDLDLKCKFGSIVKTYAPDRVVKITDGNIVFGYILIDTMDDTNNLLTKNNTGNCYQRKFVDSLEAGKASIAQRYINVFANTIYRKFKFDLNPKEIEQYSGFSDVLASLFIRAKNSNKRFNLTYAYPNEVQHYKPNTDMYGTSILDSVKMFARLYIGVITNAFMSNAIRKPERLAYYIDIGGDDDPNNSTSSVIRQIKQREARFSNMNDITSTIAAAGEFHDFFIPTIGGNRTIDIEPISLGTPREIDNDFIQFLKKSILAGTGVPKAYLGSLEDIDFARTLTMENGRFLRRIVRKQRVYESPMEETFKEVYRNEFVYNSDTLSGSNYTSKDDEEELDTIKKSKKGKATKAENSADETAQEIENLEAVLNSESTVDAINVALPLPVTLSIQIQQDQITNVDNQAEVLAESQVIGSGVDATQDDIIKRVFKKEMVRSLLPGFDWSAIDEALQKAQQEAMRIIKRPLPPAPPAPSDPSGGTDSGF